MSTGQSEYERRAARQRQLELMEASASGTLPTMELDLGDGTSKSGEAGYTSYRQRNQETARRFLFDEDDVDANRRAMNTAHAQLFSPREGRTTSVNLMDHETGVYAEPDDADYYGSDFVDTLFGVKATDEHDAAAADGDLYLGDGAKPSGHASRTSNFCAALRKRNARGKRLRYMVLGVFLFLIILIVMIVSKNNEAKRAEQSEAAKHAENTKRYEDILEAVTLAGISKPETFLSETSTEHDALRWVAYSDPARLDPQDPMLIQRYVLAVFYYGSYNDFVKDHGEQPAIEHDGEQSERVPVPGFHRRDYWLTEKGVCMWYGVKCEEDENGDTHYDKDAPIVSLNLSFNHVYGHLPREFKGLTSLVKLDLSGNEIMGTFPPELGRMFRLTRLDLHGNKLTGELPNEIGFLEGMKHLLLNDNKFQGTVPMDIERLYNLQELNLDNNNFTGEFPSIKNLASLSTLVLSNNKFNGKIPPSFTNLKSLTELHLEFNEFTGPIPEGFKQIEKLNLLWLQSNKLTGEIPGAIFESNKDLERLNLESNQFTGALPDSIGQLEHLTTFKLNENQVQGPIPESWTNMKSLKELYIQNNKLKGPLPASLGSMPELKELMLDHNEIDGQIPAALGGAGALQLVYLDHNKLTGQVPEEVSKLENLETLRLESNSLSGKVPDEVCELEKLGYLSADCPDSLEECSCCTCV